MTNHSDVVDLMNEKTALQEQNERLRKALEAFRNADDKDWAHLDMFIPQSGHGRFWRTVFAEFRTALAERAKIGK